MEHVLPEGKRPTAEEFKAFCDAVNGAGVYETIKATPIRYEDHLLPHIASWLGKRQDGASGVKPSASIVDSEMASDL